MDEFAHVNAVQEIKKLKARYFRAADTKNMALMATLLTEDCELDYSGSCRDPVTGRDVLAGVTEGKIRSRAEAIEKFSQGEGVITVHQGHTCEIEIVGLNEATGIWAMTDHLYFSPGGTIEKLTGHGHYFETYEKIDGSWFIKTLRLTRIRVEVQSREES